MSEATAYEKLRSLQEKGRIVILDSNREGRRIQVRLPSEIPGVVVPEQVGAAVNLEKQDFFEVEENRARILAREKNKCFYCLRQLNNHNYVIEHVVSRPNGDSSYRNVVAACRQCNNRKGYSDVQEFLRALYRENLLSEPDFQERLTNLRKLFAGELKPPDTDG